MKLLLVDDDRSTNELLTVLLTQNRYTVDTATDGQTGLELATLWNYDLLILDIRLPGLDGISVCRELRDRNYTVPILMLTAQNDNSAIITALDAGADDYVTKPCDTDQLLARVRALLRRKTTVTPSVLSWGALCLNPTSMQVTYQQQPVSLRPKEYSLLELFLRYPERVFSRNAILDYLWTMDDFPTEHAVTNLIKDLRRKLKASGLTADLIETIYGLGYRLQTPPEDDPTPASAPSEPSVSTPTATTTTAATATATSSSTEPQQRLMSAITQIRGEFFQSLNQRLQPLIEAVRALQQGELSPEQQFEAEEAAHRLVGSLGTFGHLEASRQARAIEHLLKQDSQLNSETLERLVHLIRDLQQQLEQSTNSLPLLSPPHTSPLLLVGLEDEFTHALHQEAQAWRFSIEQVTTGDLALQRLTETNPLAIILLVGFTDDTNDLLTLQALKQHAPSIPVMTIAQYDSLSDRVQVARWGGDSYLPQPISAAEVFETITQRLERSQRTHASVMLVDDDTFILKLLANLLKPWGLQVTCLSNPIHFWDVLTTTRPDLLILDVEMPNFNGIELCQVVRQDRIFGDLPILVITGHSDQDSMRQIFAAGADDLIHKPIVGPELVTRVMSRIERSRLRQQLSELRQQQAYLLQHSGSPNTLPSVNNPHPA